MAPLLLGGCIPPSPDHPGAPPPAPQPAPRIEGQFDTMFDEAPVWEDRPVAPSAGRIEAGRYTVQPGDTLSQIGERTGTGLAALATANGLESPFPLRVGQVLIVPAGRFHQVAAGETGIAIARGYGVPWSRIVEVNGLTEPFLLKVGQRLAIPEAGTVASQVDAARAAAFSLDIDDIVTGGEPAVNQQLAVDAPSETLSAPLSPSVPVAEPSQFSGVFSWPVQGVVKKRFGPLGEGVVNDGIDIAVAQRAPVLAASDGVVAFAGDGVTGYDSVILIRHGNGWISAYGRTAQAAVTRGQAVRRGQVIGYAGSGAAPLIHFELRRNRTPVDPLKQLPPR